VAGDWGRGKIKSMRRGLEIREQGGGEVMWFFGKTRHTMPKKKGKELMLGEGEGGVKKSSQRKTPTVVC